MEMQEYRRNKFFTQKKYQLKYTAVIMLAMLLVAVVVSTTAYWDFSHSVRYVAEPIKWSKYIVRIAFLLVVAFLCGIFLSHKIIGPIERLEKILEKINSGKFNVNIKLRTGDEFKKIAEEINKLTSKLKSISKQYPQIKDEFKEE